MIDASARSHPLTTAVSDPMPQPVARYLRLALQNSHSFPRAVRLTGSGELRTDATSSRWMRFEAKQVILPASDQFIWEARVRVAPFVDLRVRDAYVEHEGMGSVDLFSVTISQHQGGEALNSGELIRYLAEAVWYPAALIPRAELQWTAIDDDRARAALTHGSITAVLDFHFNGAGEVATVYTPSRYARVKNGYELRAWEGRFKNYTERSGMRIPLEAAAGWYIGDRWEPVWKGKILTIKQEF